MLVLWYVFAAYTLVISRIEAARILAYFPAPSISHQVVFRPLTQELAKRGHEVIVITADPAFPEGGTPPNLTEIDVHDISYGKWISEITKQQRGSTDDNILTQLNSMIRVMTEVFDNQLRVDKIHALINEKHKTFDLLLFEALLPPLLAFSHIYKAPVIQISSFGATYPNYESMGAPTHPLLYTTNIRRRLNNVTMWEKIIDLYYKYNAEKILWDASQNLGNSMIREHFGANVPPISELINNVDMLFLNIHPLFEGIRPVPPSVIYIGGIHQKPTKELPQDLKSFLDSSKHGVIYISFGTNVDPSLLPPEKIQTLVRVFSKLPYDVLWKWNKDELPGRTDNIRISKWLPQSDLLKHPKIKVFITQGGLQSTDEAITAGVPLIGMPMLGDQWFNVERYETLKIGIKLEIDLLTEDKFKDAIKKTVEDDSYRRNVEHFRSIIQDAPQSPLERAVWWTEYVLRHGGAKHLRSPSANISWSQYLELELVLALLAVSLIVITLIILVLRVVYKFMFAKIVCVSAVKIKRK